jgi:aspartate kinase
MFDDIAEAGVVGDMIVQSVGREGHAAISFTVPAKDLDRSMEVTRRLAKGFGCPEPTSAPKVAKLSASGIGMRSHTALASRMFKALAEAGINVDMINTSEVRMNVTVDATKGQQALDALRREFADVML